MSMSARQQLYLVLKNGWRTDTALREYIFSKYKRWYRLDQIRWELSQLERLKEVRFRLFRSKYSGKHFKKYAKTKPKSTGRR